VVKGFRVGLSFGGTVDGLASLPEGGGKVCQRGWQKGIANGKCGGDCTSVTEKEVGRKKKKRIFRQKLHQHKKSKKTRTRQQPPSVPLRKGGKNSKEDSHQKGDEADISQHGRKKRPSKKKAIKKEKQQNIERTLRRGKRTEARKGD